MVAYLKSHETNIIKYLYNHVYVETQVIYSNHKQDFAMHSVA